MEKIKIICHCPVIKVSPFQKKKIKTLPVHIKPNELSRRNKMDFAKKALMVINRHFENM